MSNDVLAKLVERAARQRPELRGMGAMREEALRHT
jgi:hypothetical protein